MSIETDIFNALKGLVSNRVYPDVGPENAIRPYVTYQQVGGGVLSFLEGGPPGKRNGRFQISVWAATRPEASALARQAEDAMLSLTTLSPSAEGALIARYEPQTKLYGTIQDFSFFY
jgi:hypothetical protein